MKASALFPVMRAFALLWGAFCCVRFLSAITHPSLPTSRDKNSLDQGLWGSGSWACNHQQRAQPTASELLYTGAWPNGRQRSSANSASFLIAFPEAFPTI
jgi:hypothetical protein